MNPKTLLIVDGNSLIYRAYYALLNTRMRTSCGLDTWAVFGFFRLLNKAIKEYSPTHIVFTYDEKPSERLKLAKDYKANRPDTPQELISQMLLVVELVSILKIPVFSFPGYEADDCIGTLAKRAEADGFSVLILSGDKDMLQLVSPLVKVIYTERGVSQVVPYTIEKVKEEYGLTPSQLIDFKALTGDKTDNIRGVDGIGPKKAEKLLQMWGSLECVLANLERITDKKIKESLTKSKEQLPVSLKLVKINTNLPLNINWEESKVAKPDKEKLKNFLEKLEFKSFLKEFNLDSDRKEEVKLPAYIVVEETGFTKERLISQLNTVSNFALFYNVNKNHKVEVAINTGEDIFYIKALNKWLTSNLISTLKEKEITIYDYKNWLSLTGIKMGEGRILDVKLVAFLLDSEKASPSFEQIAGRYLGAGNVVGENHKDLPAFLCYKAKILMELGSLLKNKLEEFSLTSLYREVEIPLIEILWKMEKNGIFLDLNHIKSLTAKVDKKLSEVREKIFIFAGEEFNINSSRQLAEILFKKLHLPTGKKLKTGYSTSFEVLYPLRHKYPIVELLLNYRELFKLKSTYLDTLPKLVSKDTGKLHTTFSQTIASTGRITSSNPNLQNIPVRGEWGEELRKAFSAGTGNVLLSFDYSQIDLRVLAHFCEDSRLRLAFLNNEDIHTATAYEIFNISPQQPITPQMRRVAKGINFGIIYGMSEHGLAQELEIPHSEAREFIKRYFLRYPGVKEWQEKLLSEAKANGYVTTLLGRRRLLPDINHPNPNISRQQERKALNAPIQGGAADLIKLALIKLDEYINREKLPVKVILQIHDELIFELPVNFLEKVVAPMKNIMQTVYPLNVPLVVDVKWGKNWGELKSFEGFF